MFSSYLKNNRFEDAIGEATNLRDRYPMAALGYGYLVRSNVNGVGEADDVLSKNQNLAVAQDRNRACSRKCPEPGSEREQARGQFLRCVDEDGPA